MSRNDLFLLLACAAIAGMISSNGVGPSHAQHLTFASVLPAFDHDFHSHSLPVDDSLDQR